MYFLFAISLLVLANGIWQRISLWRLGTKDQTRSTNIFSRIKIIWCNVLWQKSVNRDASARIFHSLIFSGFLVLLFTTTMVFIDHDLGIKIYQGDFYLAVTFASDMFGAGLFLGVLIAFHRRYIKRPDRLHNSKSDAVMLAILALLIIQGFILEAIRIYVTNDPWAAYSPIGYGVSLLFWGLSPSSLVIIHYLTWWIHTITVFIFIALIPYSKFFHIFASSINLYFKELDKPKGALKYIGDIETIMTEALEADGEEDFRIGVSAINDLSWKQRLDLDACTSCGRCQDVCPAYNSGKALSPKWLILDSRNHLLTLHANEEKNSDPLKKLDNWLLKLLTVTDENIQKAKNELVQQAALSIGADSEEPLSGGVMNEDVFWSCTTCRACMEVCPVGIEHVDLITDVRRSMVLMEGNIPSEAQSSLRAIETRGNPFGPREERADWAEGLDIRIIEPGEKVDVLYWVGCISSFDKRKQNIARSVAKILNHVEADWGILGNRECCTGDPARRLGEENLFQTSAKQNIKTFSEVSFNTLLTHCPHCFNSFANEYSQVSSEANYKVIHHSEYIQELISSGKISTTDKFTDSVTFHDPCYLGRYNDRYEEPREVLVQLGQKPLLEMQENREYGKCCGAGGGHFWMDMKAGERINSQRVEQAAKTNASTIATACPFCMQMMEDGAKLTNKENTLRVKDISELVVETLKTK